MQNPLSSKVKQIDGKAYVEPPVQATDILNIKVRFTLNIINF